GTVIRDHVIAENRCRSQGCGDVEGTSTHRFTCGSVVAGDDIISSEEPGTAYGSQRSWIAVTIRLTSRTCRPSRRSCIDREFGAYIGDDVVAQHSARSQRCS